jgi:hypothetical protein
MGFPLEYTAQVSDCNRSLTEGYYNLNQTGNSFVLRYVRSYHCIGSELDVGVYQNRSKLIIAEELVVSELATGCACPRMVTMNVRQIGPGNYTVEVRDYNYMLRKEPAFVQDISV